MKPVALVGKRTRSVSSFLARKLSKLVPRRSRSSISTVKFNELLPDELLERIFEVNHISESTKGARGNALRQQDLARCARVCKRWHRIAGHMLSHHLVLCPKAKELSAETSENLSKIASSTRHKTLDLVFPDTDEVPAKYRSSFYISIAPVGYNFLSEVHMTHVGLNYNALIRDCHNLRLLRCFFVQFHNTTCHEPLISNLKFLELYKCEYQLCGRYGLQDLFLNYYGYPSDRLPNLKAFAFAYAGEKKEATDLCSLIILSQIVAQKISCQVKHFWHHGNTPSPDESRFLRSIIRGWDTLQSLGLSDVGDWPLYLKCVAEYQTSIKDLTIISTKEKDSDLVEALAKFIDDSSLATLTLIVKRTNVEKIRTACEAKSLLLTEKDHFNLIQFWEQAESEEEGFWFRKGAQEDILSLKKEE